MTRQKTSKTLLAIFPLVLLLNVHLSYATSFLDLDGPSDPSGQKFFYHPDILGSTDLITNESGDIVEETTYEPHGEVIEGGNDRFLYTRKELDKQSGLYYFGARYYNPSIPLFIHPDDTVTDVYNPQDLNRYAYVRNNPYKYVDPDGETPWDIIDIGFIAYGAYRFARDPSWSTAGNLGLDVGFAVVPLVPNVKRIKEAAKALDKVKDVGKTAEKVADIGKATEKAGDVAQTAKTAQEASNLRGATNPKVREAIEQGMSEHQRFYQQMGEKGMITNKAIPGTRLRPDALDPNKRVIYELKPKTQPAVERGEKQLQRYQQSAKGVYGGKWRTQVRTYKPRRSAR